MGAGLGADREEVRPLVGREPARGHGDAAVLDRGQLGDDSLADGDVKEAHHHVGAVGLALLGGHLDGPEGGGVGHVGVGEDVAELGVDHEGGHVKGLGLGL